jgi:hypothetical protein
MCRELGAPLGLDGLKLLDLLRIQDFRGVVAKDGGAGATRTISKICALSLLPTPDHRGTACERKLFLPDKSLPGSGKRR